MQMKNSKKWKINRTITFISFILSMIILCFNVNAQDSSCPLSLLEKADRSISRLENWQDIYKSFKKFRQCDDGYIAEGYSDAVVKTLANKWSQLNILIKFTSQDKDFYAFVISHIDATTDKSEIEMIISNSGKRCPKSASNICSEIESAAKKALKEIEEEIL
jgi:hypothetical protein